MWARDYSACVTCGGTERPHVGNGDCSRCYMAKYNKANPERVEKARQKYYKAYKGAGRDKIAREAKAFDGKREKVLTRDGFKCVRCGSSKKLTVHHKDRTGRGAAIHNNSLDNLETVCRKCHAAEHRKELNEARAAKKLTCVRGHPRTPEFGYFRGPGKRGWVCRPCTNYRATLYREGSTVKQK